MFPNAEVEATESGVVLGPIRVSVRVQRPVIEAFDLFTRHIGRWWPMDLRYARGPVVDVVFEERLGGRIYEVCADGATADWGRVRKWQPPHTLVFSWQPGRTWPEATEVEVHFSPEPDGSTRVDLEHRHWENLGGSAAARDTHACHAGDEGWPLVLAQLVLLADAPNAR